MDDSEPRILKFPAPSEPEHELESEQACPIPDTLPAQSMAVPAEPTPRRAASPKGPFASHVFDAMAMPEPPSDTTPDGASSVRNAKAKKSRALKLKALKKLNPIAATLVVLAGFAGLGLWEMTREKVGEIGVFHGQQNTRYAYPVLLSHRLPATNAATETGAAMDAVEGDSPTLLPSSQLSPYPPSSEPDGRIRLVAVSPPTSFASEEFDDIPVLGGSADPRAGDDAELDVMEARVKSRLRREQKLPPEEPEPGSIEDFRQRIESGKNTLVNFVSGKELRP